MLSHRKKLSFVAIGFLFLSSCSQAPTAPVIKIGCAAPLTGDQAQLGVDVCRGLELAVKEANQRGEIVPGYTLQVLSLDDQHNPAQAVNVAKKFVSDPNVVAVMGHFNSSCTKPASAIYHEARITQITASSTNPDLSRQGFDTFFRVAATDEVQGPKAAQFVNSKLGIKKVFVIDDKTTYGKGLADEFTKEAVRLGISVLGHEGITQGDKDFSPLLTRIKPLAPELIYFGGIYPEGALLIRQARSLGLSAPFMGGDGLASPILIDLASAAIAEGTYSTMVGGDMEKIPAAQSFMTSFRTHYGEPGQWAAYGYDAGNILITAIQQAGVSSREAILKTMRQIPSFTGITGEVTFDALGDNQHQFIGVFQVHNGKLDYIGPAE